MSSNIYGIFWSDYEGGITLSRLYKTIEEAEIKLARLVNLCNARELREQKEYGIKDFPPNLFVKKQESYKGTLINYYERSYKERLMIIKYKIND